MRSGVLVVAIVVIATGLASLAYEGTIPLPPMLGGLALAGGVALLVVGARRQAPRRYRLA